MRREFHVRFCEGAGAQFPRATRLIITARNEELLTTKILPAVTVFLAERGLRLSPEKSNKAFAKVDTAIYWALWRWAKRKHPQKPAYWLLRKYTRRLQRHQSVFGAHAKAKRAD